MRSSLIMWLCILAGGTSSGQNGFMVHFDNVQMGRNGRGCSIRESENGFILFSGQFAPDIPSRMHFFVGRLDPDGYLLSEDQYLVGEDIDIDPGYIDPFANHVGGNFSAAIGEGYSHIKTTWLYTFDSSGDTLSRKYLMSYDDQDTIWHAVRQTRSTSDGGQVLVGFYHAPPSAAQGWLVKVGPLGDTLWTRRYGLNTQANDIQGVGEYVDGGYIVTGYRLNPGSRIFLKRLDQQGNEIWERLFGLHAGTNSSVRVCTDGTITTLSTHRELSWPGDWQKLELTKWDPQGEIIWRSRTHYGYRTYSFDMEELLDGSLIVSGMYVDSAGNGIIAKFSSDGDSLWTRKYYMLHGEHYFHDVEPTSDGGFIATGIAWRYPPSDPDIMTTQVIWAVKTDSMGCVVPGCHLITEVDRYVMDLNEHLRVWPVPTMDILNIQLPLPSEFQLKGQVHAILLDVQGRQVDHWLVPDLGSELHMQHRLPKLAPGTYFLHLKDQDSWLAGAKVVVE
jgi:hypothetical protein